MDYENKPLEELTKAELNAALQDQWWRLNNLYWITDKAGKLTVFRPNWAQTELYENFHYLNIIVKARQLGCTTFMAIMALDESIFYPNVRCGVIAHTKEDAEIIFRDKIRFAFEELPNEIKVNASPSTERSQEILFGNNSGIRVGTSMRSSTLQILHISEYAKVCAKWPEKAKEIRTGALNTVQAGQIITIESTTEGAFGHFFDLAQVALKNQQANKKLTKLDWKLHFFPWYKEPEYVMNDEESSEVIETADDLAYFLKVEAETGWKFTRNQRAWYIKKRETQGHAEMFQEYPSSMDEAFHVSVEGAYYTKQMAQARIEGRITKVPHDPALKTSTFWDLGWDDSTTIVFMQAYNNSEWRIIDYFEANGEPLDFYVKHLQSLPYVWDKHYLPHDVAVHSLETGRTREDALKKLGLTPLIKNHRIAQESDGWQAVREVLHKCWFDEEKCGQLIKCLDNYKKEFDEKLARYKSTPLHNWASHGAKAFEQLAIGYSPSAKKSTRKKNRSWRTS